jgi:hypothetical protein
MGPDDDRIEDRLDLPAHLGQLVLHAHRRGGHDLAFDKPGSLELTKALRQQRIAQFRDGRLDVGEAVGAREQSAKHCPGPAGTEDIAGVREWVLAAERAGFEDETRASRRYRRGRS